MWSMMSVMLPSVEYLHSMSCSCLRPLYVGSSLSLPSGPIVYPMALIMSGLWWVGLYCAGRMYSGMMWGVSPFSFLSSCSPSCSGCVMGGRFEGVVSFVVGMFFWKSVTGCLPRSTPMTGHLPPFDFCRSWWSRRKVLLCLLVRSPAVWLHPPRMCVLFKGDWHFEQLGVGPVLLLHLCMCTPHATSRASRRARYGDVEYACMVWSAPFCLACLSMLLYIVLVALWLLYVCVLTSLRRLV